MNYAKRTLTLTQCTAAEVREILQGVNESEVLVLLQQIKGDLQTIMATQAEFEAQLSRIDASTTASAAAAAAIKANMEALKTEIANAGLTKDQEASLLAKVSASGDTAEALSAFLTAIASPGVPEPAPVPVPEPTPDAG